MIAVLQPADDANGVAPVRREDRVRERRRQARVRRECRAPRELRGVRECRANHCPDAASDDRPAGDDRHPIPPIELRHRRSVARRRDAGQRAVRRRKLHPPGPAIGRRHRVEIDRQSRRVRVRREEPGADLDAIPEQQFREEQRFAAAGRVGERYTVYRVLRLRPRREESADPCRLIRVQAAAGKPIGHDLRLQRFDHREQVVAGRQIVEQLTVVDRDERCVGILWGGRSRRRRLGVRGCGGEQRVTHGEREPPPRGSDHAMVRLASTSAGCVTGRETGRRRRE